MMKIKAGLSIIESNGQYTTKHKRRHETNKRRPKIMLSGGNNAVAGDKVKDKQSGLDHYAVVKKPMMTKLVTRMTGDEGKQVKIELGNERTYPDVALARLAFEKDAANKLDINETNRPTINRSAKSYAMAVARLPADKNGKRESNNSSITSGSNVAAFVAPVIERKRKAVISKLVGLPFKCRKMFYATARLGRKSSKLSNSHKMY